MDDLTDIRLRMTTDADGKPDQLIADTFDTKGVRVDSRVIVSEPASSDEPAEPTAETPAGETTTGGGTDPVDPPEPTDPVDPPEPTDPAEEPGPAGPGADA